MPKIDKQIEEIRKRLGLDPPEENPPPPHIPGYKAYMPDNPPPGFTPDSPDSGPIYLPDPEALKEIIPRKNGINPGPTYPRPSDPPKPQRPRISKRDPEITSTYINPETEYLSHQLEDQRIKHHEAHNTLKATRETLQERTNEINQIRRIAQDLSQSTNGARAVYHLSRLLRQLNVKSSPIDHDLYLQETMGLSISLNGPEVKGSMDLLLAKWHYTKGTSISQASATFDQEELPDHT